MANAPVTRTSSELHRMWELLLGIACIIVLVVAIFDYEDSDRTHW